MNTVPLTPAEILERNKRAAEIIASHASSPQAKCRAQAILDKTAVAKASNPRLARLLNQ